MARWPGAVGAAACCPGQLQLSHQQAGHLRAAGGPSSVVGWLQQQVRQLLQHFDKDCMDLAALPPAVLTGHWHGCHGVGPEGCAAVADEVVVQQCLVGPTGHPAAPPAAATGPCSLAGAYCWRTVAGGSKRIMHQSQGQAAKQEVEQKGH